MREPPRTIAQLEERIAHVAKLRLSPVERVRTMLCSLIVSQLLPPSMIVKGGIGLALRFGDDNARFTSDLDVASQPRGSEVMTQLSQSLQSGWGVVPPSRKQLAFNPQAKDQIAFTAALKDRPLHDTGLDRPEYVVHPFKVSIHFLGKNWSSLRLEISDAEIGTLAEPRDILDKDIHSFMSEFACGTLRPVRVMSLEHQIAQKLHAVTDPTYSRAHDLIDLQLLASENPDLDRVRTLTERTFSWRAGHSWPLKHLPEMTGWESSYESSLRSVGDTKSHLLA